MFLSVSLLFTTSVLVHKLKLAHLMYCNEFFVCSGSGMELLKDSEQRDYAICLLFFKKINISVIDSIRSGSQIESFARSDKSFFFFHC